MHAVPHLQHDPCQPRGRSAMGAWSVVVPPSPASSNSHRSAFGLIQGHPRLRGRGRGRSREGCLAYVKSQTKYSDRHK